MLGAQVRVMPTCWFVLLRFWLRVDRVLVRLYETRLMGSFHRAPGAPLVSREIRQSEGAFQQLRSAGAPPAGVGFRMSLTGSARVTAVPVRMCRLTVLSLARGCG